MRKYLITLMLFLFFVLTACGKDETSITEGDNNPFGKYDEVTTVELVRTSDASIESDILSYYTDETLQNNRFTQLFKDKLNIEITYKFIAANPEQYRTQINMAMSIGNLPHFLMVDAKQAKELYEAEQIIDLKEYWDIYASDLLKEITLQEGNYPLDVVTLDETLYGIPQIYSSIDRSQFIWVRMDWIDKLNNEKNLNLPTDIKTLEDLETIARAFVNEDPDGNGRKDTYGILNQGDLWNELGGLTGLFNTFGSYPNIWLEKNNELVYGSIQPETKDALSKLRSMYEEGLIHREFVTTTSETVADRVKQSKAGIFLGEQWASAYPIQALYNLNSNTKWKAFPLVSITNDKKTKTQLTHGTYGWWVASKNAKNPEAIIKMMNVYVEAIWGETGDFENYYMPEDTGLPVWKLSPINPEPPTKNLDAYLAIKDALTNDTLDLLEGEAKQIYNQISSYNNGNKNLWSWSKGYNPLDDPVYEVMDYYYKNDLFVYDKFNSAPTETMNSRLTYLQNEQNKVFTNIINGTQPLSNFDTFVNNWMNLGGSDIIQEVNQWYLQNN